MSDVHLGARDCVLRAKGGADPLAVNGAFARFLEAEVGKVDTFILLGDIYELALSTYDQAVPRVSMLLERLRERGTERVIVVPGNHDHYIWTLTRDQHEITNRYPHYAPSPYFPARIQSWYPKTSWNVEVAYPNIYWNPPDGGRRTFIFHHGHYCSETYTLISDLYRDLFDGQVATIPHLEGINSGWIDLVWYHLGQSGAELGANGLIDSIYADIRKHGTSPALKNAAERLYRLKISDGVRKALHDKADQKWWMTRGMADFAADQLDKRAPSWLEGLIRAYALHEAGNDRRGKAVERGMALDEELIAQCDKYVTTSVASEPLLEGRLLSFVFGHTHVHGVASTRTAAYSNTGGWIEGPRGEAPDAYIFKIDRTGQIAMKRYS